VTVAADTSFLIALFTDEPRAVEARETFARLKEKREKVFIPFQAIVEVIYVLEKFYKLERPRVTEYVLSILNTFIFIVEKDEFLYRVLDGYVRFPAIGVGDIIIAEQAREMNISRILTFDRHFEKLGMNTSC
jgi:predicted nucleic-acid-binding protein